MPRLIPLNFFGIPFGLLGLADSWLVAASFGLAPVAIGRVLVAIAVLAWVVVGSAHLRGMLAHRVRLGAELADPVAGPFFSLVVLTPMLAAADALYPYSHTAGTVVVDVGVASTIVLAGWFTGQWIYGHLELAEVHPGYFLPSVAGGFVASASAALVGQIGLAEMLFGLGLISWIVIGSIVLGRLFLGPPLATPLMPTIAIEVAPAAVATFAAFVIDGQRVDTLVRVLAGYGLLMVVAQVRLLPTFLKLKFMPSFWAFTFAWAAVAFAGLFWLGVTHPTGWRAESYMALGLITAFIGAIAARTVLALYRGQLIPVLQPDEPTMIDGHARSLLLGDLPSEVDAIVVGAGAAGCALAGGSEQRGEQIMLLKAGPAVPDSESLEPAATLNRVFGDTPYQDATMPQPTVGGRAVNIVSWFEGHRADYDGWAAAGADGWSAQHVISSFQRIEHYAIGQIASMRCRRSHGH